MLRGHNSLDEILLPSHFSGACISHNWRVTDVVIDDDKINIFFLIRFMSENLSKLAHREPAQFTPGMMQVRRKTCLNALPSVQREATFVLHTNQRNVLPSCPLWALTSLLKYGVCWGGWLGQLFNICLATMKALLSLGSEGCSIPLKLKGKL